MTEYDRGYQDGYQTGIEYTLQANKLIQEAQEKILYELITTSLGGLVKTVVRAEQRGNDIIQQKDVYFIGIPVKRESEWTGRTLTEAVDRAVDRAIDELL